MPRKHNAISICQQCGEKFTHYAAPSIPPRKYCSPACSSIASRLKSKPCPICDQMFHPTSFGSKGRKQTCSKTCGNVIGAAKKRVARVWTAERIEFLKKHYPHQGAQFCTAQIGLSLHSIRTKANRLGLCLTPSAKQRLVHNAAKEYMTKHNPMFNQETVDKVQDWYNNHPEQRERIMAKMRRGHQRIRKDQPTKVQVRFWKAMELAGLSFEKEFIIKPKFIVDAAFPAHELIVELDGCYWHGHSHCFSDLTERQVKQQIKDRAKDKYLITCGWQVLRIWECEFNRNPNGCVDRIRATLTTAPTPCQES